MQHKIIIIKRAFTVIIINIYKLHFVFCSQESQVQLGSRDGGAHPRIVFLGLHRDANPRRIHLLQAGCKQVGASMPDTKQPQMSSLENALLFEWICCISFKYITKQNKKGWK